MQPNVRFLSECRFGVDGYRLDRVSQLAGLLDGEPQQAALLHLRREELTSVRVVEHLVRLFRCGKAVLQHLNSLGSIVAQ